jgi:ATP-dependent Lon protease
MSISEVTKKISSAVDESLSRQQKEFYLRQQLAVIQRELHALSNNRASSPLSSQNSHSDNQASELDDDDSHEASDLADLKVKIEAMRPGSEERRMGVREWRRFKRIPSGSVESGVVRSYVSRTLVNTWVGADSASQLEWLTSLPWPSAISSPPTSTLDRSFLTNARAQLDADHFGLEKIKKRLIEYLAVLRLKEINLVQEEANAATKEDSAMKPTNESAAAKKAVKGPILL